MNREAPIPDNGDARQLVSASRMRHEHTSIRSRRGSAPWPRRAVVGLWVLAYVLGGVTLAARWDLLMARLARPPVSEAPTAVEGAVR